MPTPAPTLFESYPGELPTEDAESAAIIAGWQEYQRVYEKFAKAPNKYTDYTETQYVTTGHESIGFFDKIDALRDRGLELVGRRAFRDLSVSKTVSEPDGTSTAVLTYCLDLDALEVRDVSTGELVERGGVYEEVAYMRQGLDGVWRVEGLNTLEECP